MNLPFQWFRPKAGAADATEHRLTPVVGRSDVQWNTRVFRAPALPTPQQFSSELPFTVNFPRNHFARR
jgi:hypothetical protein